MNLMRTIVTNRRAAVLAGAGLLALSACGPATTAGSSDGGAEETAAAVERTEVAALTPRIVLAYDGGVMTLDSSDGEVLDQTEMPGYLRLNPAGDGRTVVVSGNDAFTMYDTGLEAMAHGDHYHYYEQSPRLTDLTVEAPLPGHVVPHGDRTALFADGTGEITLIDPAGLAAGELDVLGTETTDDPHHGVAVPLSDGGLLTTQGTEDARSTVQVRDAEGTVVAETDDCPGVHGEATAQPTESGDVVTLGCENGPVVYRDGAFHKVEVPEEYQRSGNQKGSEDSPIVLTDYKVEEDPAGDIERPTRIGLLDTRDDSMTTVGLGAEYWFRSLDRGPDGEALVLTTDGELNILDPVSGEILHEVPVTEEWTEPDEWQTAAPMLAVADGTAFVVDPDSQHLTMVDIATGEAYQEIDLPVVPHEIQVTSGTVSGEYEVSGESHSEDEHASDEGGEDGHEGHDH